MNRLFSKALKTGLFYLMVQLVVGCASYPPPYEEYSLARTAIDSAKSVESARYSPGNWHEAEEAYKIGKEHFSDRRYLEAKESFIKARISAEKAENQARYQKMQSGEVF